jgi:DNA-binding MarR family transcriptional regulator
MATDYVDVALEQWRDERPEVDTAALGMVSRVLRLATHLRKRDEQLLENFGLAPWGYEVLAALRRQGAPYSMTPTELRHATLLTAGGMTNRLDRLETEGWVERKPDPNDGRGVLVRLTASGRRIVDATLEDRIENAEVIFQPLTAGEQGQLASLLRKVLLPLSSRNPGLV